MPSENAMSVFCPCVVGRAHDCPWHGPEAEVRHEEEEHNKTILKRELKLAVEALEDAKDREIHRLRALVGKAYREGVIDGLEGAEEYLSEQDGQYRLMSEGWEQSRARAELLEDGDAGC